MEHIMIALDNIDKTYYHGTSSKRFLKSINLKIKPGEIFGIIGPSGAGKSTLLRLINRLEQESSGSITVDGQKLATLNPHDLAKLRTKIGMIFQHFNLLESKTVQENVALALRIAKTPSSKIAPKVQSLLKMVALWHKRADYPHSLSGGQQQRVAIARALATDPKILLCDEATSALDPQTSESILALLKKIQQELGLTIVLISHQMQVIKSICDRVGVIEEGQLLEVAPILDLITAPKSSAAKALSAATMHINRLPHDALKPKNSSISSTYIRCVFQGDAVNEPILSRVCDRHKVRFNILEAHIETIAQTTLGVSICQLIGHDQQIKDTISNLKKNLSAIEVLDYV